MFTLFLLMNAVIFTVIASSYENDVWKFEMDLPNSVENYVLNNEYTRQNISESEEQPDTFRITVSGLGVIALQKFVQMAARKFIERPGVEVGPGAFKNDIVTYPPNKFINDLKKLIKLKQKMDGDNIKN